MKTQLHFLLTLSFFSASAMQPNYNPAATAGLLKLLDYSEHSPNNTFANKVTIFLAQKANPNAHWRVTLPLFIWAVRNEQLFPTVPELLLKAGANPNVKDAQGYTAFRYCSIDMLKILLAHDADPDIQYECGFPMTDLQLI